MNKPSDPHTQLMLRLQGGDEGAFKKLFNEYKYPLLNYIYRFCLDKIIAEELSHEVFLRIYKYASSYQPKARFSTWIYRIATNICLNDIRSMKHHYEVPYTSLQIDKFEDTSQEHPLELLEKHERQTAVRKCVAALPQKYRIAILMSCYQQLPYKEIANRLGCSIGAVKSMIHRSKLMIKENLKNEDLINKYDVKSCWSYPLHQIHLRQLTQQPPPL